MGVVPQGLDTDKHKDVLAGHVRLGPQQGLEVSHHDLVLFATALPPQLLLEVQQRLHQRLWCFDLGRPLCGGFDTMASQPGLSLLDRPEVGLGCLLQRSIAIDIAALV